MPRRRWTDDDLRRAIEGARTWAEVCRALGLTHRGGATAALRRRCAELGIDHSHIGGPLAQRRWSDEQLCVAVAASTNLRQVFLALGLKVGGGSWVAMQEHIRRLRLDTSHWDRPVPATSRPRGREQFCWTDEEIMAAADGARSVAQVMERLGLDPRRNRGRAHLERRMRELGHDPTSLPGQGWSAGARAPVRYRKPLEEILVAGKAISSTQNLKRRLVAEGVLAWRCAICGIDEWRGEPLVLQLDHINGDRFDNRRENLRLLCPNCHSQTDTFAGRNTASR